MRRWTVSGSPAPVWAFESLAGSREAELAVARWLMAPDLVALAGQAGRLDVRTAARVGIVLHAAMLTKLLGPHTPGLRQVIDALARRADCDPRGVGGGALQDYWKVLQMPYEVGRLQQRMRELALEGKAHLPSGPR